MASVIGQKCTLDLVVTEKRGSMDEDKTITVELPYDMNDIVINLNAYLDGADKDTYLTEFVSLMPAANQEETTEDVSIGDDFGVPTAE